MSKITLSFSLSAVFLKNQDKVEEVIKWCTINQYPSAPILSVTPSYYKIQAKIRVSYSHVILEVWAS